MGNRLTSPINLAIDSKGHQRTRGIAVEIPHSRASKHSVHIQQNTPIVVLYQEQSILKQLIGSYEQQGGCQNQYKFKYWA